jgi:hypothetical protein
MPLQIASNPQNEFASVSRFGRMWILRTKLGLRPRGFRKPAAARLQK